MAFSVERGWRGVQILKMKRWENAGYLLGGLVQSLLPRMERPKNVDDLPILFGLTDAEVRSAVTSIVAGKGVPSSLSPTASFCLSTRVLCALDFLGQILLERSPVQEPRADCTDAQVLEWLLTDLFVQRSDQWLRLTRDAIARGVKFY